LKLFGKSKYLTSFYLSFVIGFLSMMIVEVCT